MRPVIPEVRDVMTAGVEVIAANDTLAAAQRLMQEYEIRHLPVLRERELVGILSDRDIHRAQALACAPLEAIPVEHAMTPDPYSVRPTDPLNAVARTMADRKVGSAVVVEHNAILGVFTTTDALETLVDVLEGREVEHVYESTFTAPPKGRRSREPDIR